MKQTDLIMKIVSLALILVMLLSVCGCVADDDTSAGTSDNAEITTLENKTDAGSEGENTDVTTANQDEPEAPQLKEFNISRFEYSDKGVESYDLPRIEILSAKCTENGILELELKNRTENQYVFRGIHSMYETTTTNKTWNALTGSGSSEKEIALQKSTAVKVELDLTPYFKNGIEAGEYRIDINFPLSDGYSANTCETVITFTLGRPSVAAKTPEGIDMTPTTAGIDSFSCSYSGAGTDYYNSLKKLDSFASDILIIPETHNDFAITAIDASGFYRSELKHVIMNDSMRYVAIKAFQESKKLESVIFGKDVYKVDSEAFSSCTALKYVYLNEGLFYIGLSAFKDCASLTEINIPSTVRTIQNNAFAGCTNLKEINYNGTKAEWASVNKSGTWINSSITVHCLDGDVVEQVPNA